MEAMAEWQGKIKDLGETPVQVPHGLTRACTHASRARGWQLSAWAMAWPRVLFTVVSDISSFKNMKLQQQCTFSLINHYHMGKSYLNHHTMGLLATLNSVAKGVAVC
jgi:hypothetical protein